MANNTKPQAKQRRPAKKRPPLKAMQNNTATKIKPVPKKKLPKKSLTASKKAAASKKSAPKRNATKVTAKKASRRNAKVHQTRLISLPFGRNAKLVLLVNRSKPLPKSHKAAVKKTSKTKPKSPSKLRELILSSTMLIAGIIGVGYYGWHTVTPSLMTGSVYYNHDLESPALPPPPPKQKLPASPPVALRAPSIKLDAPLASVGLRQDGTMEVPNYTMAGWYRMGPTPGETGPAVIVGHLDNIHGTAVFWRLKELAPGQTLEIERQDGKNAKFVVEKVARYSQANFPTSEVYGEINYPGLRLITCSGTFNHRTQRYSDNTIVYASMVPDKQPTVSLMKLLSIKKPVDYQIT